MRKLKVLISFIKFSVAEQLSYYVNVLTNMKGNANFPAPAISYVEAQTAVDNLTVYNSAARGGDRTAIANMHVVELSVQKIFRYYASYVEMVADGNESIIASSGMDMSKQPATYQKPVLKAVNGSISGTAMLAALMVPKSGSYIWQIARGTLPLTAAGWEELTITTRTTHKVEGLTPTVVYYFRVAAVTPDGIQNFTAPVMLVMR